MSEAADLVLNTVKDAQVESQRRKRSVDETEQESSSLCKQTSDPESGEQTPSTDIYYTTLHVVCPLHTAGPFLITKCG